MGKRLYLLIGGYCDYNEHEGLVGICSSLDGAKALAQAHVEKVWDIRDSYAREKARRYELVWGDMERGVWYGSEGLRIEPWELDPPLDSC